MTRSSTKELHTPLDNSEQVFHSRRKLFATSGLEGLSSSEFSPPSTILEQHKEEQTEKELTDKEITKTMTKTMEHHMSKTRDNCGSGVARPRFKANA
uniref:Uncharacterized protein n=1 Tax=Tanacetum cinerariifolium TaxID=118510 RepID=A0A699H8V7_TANCI|nr:hypothetical protein [Tanacetum cinerariifolium]